MRQSKTLKICANHLIIAGMTVQEHVGNDKSCACHASDFADGELKDEMFYIRFASVEREWNLPVGPHMVNIIFELEFTVKYKKMSPKYAMELIRSRRARVLLTSMQDKVKENEKTQEKKQKIDDEAVLFQLPSSN